MIKQRHYQHLNLDKGILSILYKRFTPNHSLLHIFSHIRIKEKLSKTIKSIEECISKWSSKHIRKQPLFLAKISIAIVSIILHAFFKFDWLVSFWSIDQNCVQYIILKITYKREWSIFVKDYIISGQPYRPKDCACS